MCSFSFNGQNLKWIVICAISIFGIQFVLFGALFSICIGNIFINSKEFPPENNHEWMDLQKAGIIISAVFMIIIMFSAFGVTVRDRIWISGINAVIGFVMIGCLISFTLTACHVRHLSPFKYGRLWNKTVQDLDTLHGDSDKMATFQIGINQEHKRIPKWLHLIQLETSCCGLKNAEDYRTLWEIPQDEFRVPYSCCFKRRRDRCRDEEYLLDDLAYRNASIKSNKSCLKEMNRKVQRSAFILLIFSCILLGLEVLALIILIFLFMLELSCFVVLNANASQMFVKGPIYDADGNLMNSGFLGTSSSSVASEGSSGGASTASTVSGNASASASVTQGWGLEDELKRLQSETRQSQWPPGTNPNQPGVPATQQRPGSPPLAPPVVVLPQQQQQNIPQQTPEERQVQMFYPPSPNSNENLARNEILNNMVQNQTDSDPYLESQSADSMKEVRKKMAKADKKTEKRKKKFLKDKIQRNPKK